MASSLTCDRCACSEIVPCGWYSVRSTDSNRVTTFHGEPIGLRGDFCSMECLIDAAIAAKAATDEFRIKVS